MTVGISGQQAEGYYATQGIYIITTEDDFPCKVGITDFLSHRIAGMQTGNWNKLFARQMYFPYKVAGRKFDILPSRLNTVRISAKEFERIAHKKLTDLDTHINGEWFGIHANDADAVLRKLADMEGYRLIQPQAVMAMDTSILCRKAEVQSARELLEAATDALTVIARGRLDE